MLRVKLLCTLAAMTMAAGCASGPELSLQEAKASTVKLAIDMPVEQVKAIYGEPTEAEVKTCGGKDEVEEWLCYTLRYNYPGKTNHDVFFYFANSKGPKETSGPWLLSRWKIT